MAEVGVARLRQELKAWLARAQDGEEVIVTDRGRPVARLSAVEPAPVLVELEARGWISRPRRPRPQARGLRRVVADGAVSDDVVAERESRRR